MKKIYIILIFFISILGAIFIVKNSSLIDKNTDLNDFIRDLDEVNGLKFEEQIDNKFVLVQETNDVVEIISLLKEVEFLNEFTTITFNENDARYKITLYHDQKLTHEYYLYPDYIKLKNDYSKVKNLNKTKILEILGKN